MQLKPFYSTRLRR